MTEHHTLTEIQVIVISVSMGHQIKQRDELYLISQKCFGGKLTRTHLELV